MEGISACFRHPALTVHDIAGKGRGVFTTGDIPQGTLLEVSPVIPVPHVHLPAYRTLPLYHYSFAWEDGSDAVALGVVSLVNHGAEPNIRLTRDHDGLALVMHSLRDLRAGEELVYDYQCPLWFDVKE